MGFGFRLGPGGCVCGLGSGWCGPLSTLCLFAFCPGGSFCCCGLFAAGFFVFPSAASLTPYFLTPSSTSPSALSFPSRTTSDGTFTHSCSALLPCGVSYSCCHRSTFSVGCPFFVLQPLLRDPSSHSVAPSVTSCESTRTAGLPLSLVPI